MKKERNHIFVDSEAKDIENSFYSQWELANFEGRIYWAERMVYACNKAIEDIITRR